MRAVDRVASLVDARRVRENEFRAKCPVHGGHSDGSLSIKDAGDKVLVHCHAGCPVESVLQAIGMTSTAELFDSSTALSDPVSTRQARIRRGLEVWCERRMIHVCQQLRNIEQTIADTAGLLARYEDGTLPADPTIQERLWENLANTYRQRNEFEEQFSILHNGNLQTKYALFRVLK